MKLLHHCPVSEGGLAEYSRHQAAALAEVLSVAFLWHAPESVRLPERFRALQPLLDQQRRSGRNKLRRVVDFAVDTLSACKELSEQIKQRTQLVPQVSGSLYE